VAGRSPTIFHVTTEATWRAAQAAGEHRVSTRGRSLEDEGFIHCSDAHQVSGVAGALYGDAEEPLVVLEIDVDRLEAEVCYENLEGGTDLFPHVYGPLPVGAVVSALPLRRDATGSFPFPMA
jgi:uncharacterized protein (DUF952 family)